MKVWENLKNKLHRKERNKKKHNNKNILKAQNVTPWVTLNSWYSVNRLLNHLVQLVHMYNQVTSCRSRPLLGSKIDNQITRFREYTYLFTAESLSVNMKIPRLFLFDSHTQISYTVGGRNCWWVDILTLLFWMINCCPLISPGIFATVSPVKSPKV